jgi:hypothetical protein
MTARKTKDYMLTVWSAGPGARDIQVNNAPDMATAIRLAEKETGCRVDHGRSGIGSEFDPNIIIDARTGIASFLHDRPADGSMQIVGGVKVTVVKGEGHI